MICNFHQLCSDLILHNPSMSIDPSLSTNTLQCPSGILLLKLNPLSLKYFISSIVTITSLGNCDNATYTDPAVLNAIAVGDFELQIIGQLS